MVKLYIREPIFQRKLTCRLNDYWLYSLNKRNVQSFAIFQSNEDWIYSYENLLIYLLTYMGVFGLDFVSKLLPDKAAQTHNPYAILIPY